MTLDQGQRVRVIIVDDATEVRRLLRLLFAGDDRFEVVGEGEDGIEAIELASTLQADLLLLDRQMPRMGGVEAIPEIRRCAPHTAVILFTASATSGTSQAALSAGALDVLEKSVDGRFVDRLAETLLDHWAHPDDEVHVRLGPVPSSAARAWIANTRLIVGALRQRPDVLAAPPPAEVLDIFDRFIQVWDEVSHGPDDFFWSARAKFSDIERLLEWWVVIDDMSDEQIAELGVGWSSPEARPFYHALTESIMRAINEHASAEVLARALRRQWTRTPDSRGLEALASTDEVVSVPGGGSPASSNTRGSRPSTAHRWSAGGRRGGQRP